MRDVEWKVSLLKFGGGVVVPDLISAKNDWDISRKIIWGGSMITATDVGDLVGATLLTHVRVPGDGWKPHGRFEVTACDPSFSSEGHAWTVEWMDETIRLDRQRLLYPVSVPSTTRPVIRVRQRLAELGVTAGIDDSDQTVRTSMAFTPTQTRLDEVTKLLESIDYHPLWASATGLYSGPHRDPADQAPVHRFIEGEGALHLPRYPQQQNFVTVPNRLMGMSKGDSNNPPLSAIVRDQASTPWSFAKRGYWVDGEPITLEVANQEQLVVATGRMLRELQMNAITMTVQHVWTPNIVPGCVVEFQTSRPEVNGRWQAVSSSIDMVGVGALASTTVRKVVSW